MTGNEYQKLAMRTCQIGYISLDDMIRHSLFGMASEVGEVHAVFQKVYQGHELDIGKVKEEVGDVLWMIAELCEAYGWNLDDVMNENIEKLKKRYPNGFDSERSIHRD